MIIYYLQGTKKYKIIKFINTAGKEDLALISSRWLSLSGGAVYSPPSSVPSLILAKQHVNPCALWKKCDVIYVMHTSSKTRYYNGV